MIKQFSKRTDTEHTRLQCIVVFVTNLIRRMRSNLFCTISYINVGLHILTSSSNRALKFLRTDSFRQNCTGSGIYPSLFPFQQTEILEMQETPHVFVLKILLCRYLGVFERTSIMCEDITIPFLGYLSPNSVQMKHATNNGRNILQVSLFSTLLEIVVCS